MIKKLSKYFISALFVLPLLLFGGDAQAFFLMKIIKSKHIQLPMPDFVGEAVETGKSVGTLALSAQKLKNATETTINNTMAQVNGVFNFDYNALLDGQINAGQLGIVNCNFTDYSVDVYDEENVKEAVKILFMRYPGWENTDKEKYDAYRSAFYRDTIVEIYTAARQLQIDMSTRIKPTIEKASKCVKGESSDCGIPAPDGNSESAYSEAKALESLDNLLMVLEKATALKAQLRAAKAIYGIEPEPFPVPAMEELPDDIFDVVPEQSSPTGEQSASLEQPLLYELAYSSATTGRLPLAFGQLRSYSAGTQAVSALSRVENTASDTTGAQGIVVRTLTFAEAPESEIFHPYDLEQEKMDELDKIEPLSKDVNVAINAHNTIRELKSYQNAAKNYKEAVEKHKEALKSLKASDDAGITYLSRYYAKPIKAWSGIDLKEEEVGNYDLRKGISGWAAEAFDIAKAAQVTTVSPEDIAQPDIDTDTADLTDVGNPEKNMKLLEKQDTFSSPSTEEQNIKENREAMLMSWQTGAEAAKLLLEEPEKWGVMIKPFPIWTDVKSFYDQYLEGKYTNIAAYLKSFSTSDVRALVLSTMNGQKYDIKETKYQKQLTKINNKMADDLQKLIIEKKSREYQYADENNPTMKGLLAKRKKLIKKMDDAADLYKKLSDELAAVRAKAKDDATNSMQEEVTDFDDYEDHMDDLKVDIDAETVTIPAEVANAPAEELRASNKWNTADKLANVSGQRAEENKKDSDAKSLQERMENINTELKKLRKELENLDELIKLTKLNNQKSSATVAKEFTQKFEDLNKSVAAQIAKAGDSFTADVDKNIGSLASKVFEKLKAAHDASVAKLEIKPPFAGPSVADLTEGFNKAVEAALDELYAAVDARIKLAREELEQLDDTLYKATGHPKVAEIHQRMIDDIKILVLVVNYKPLDIAVSVKIYEKLLTADVSPDNSEFFVGEPAKERDLKAPKKILDFDLPPVREIFHFDEDDYQNVKPYDEKRTETETVPHDDFLKYGGEIPKIWEYMLAEHAFVEREFNLKDALEKNEKCSLATFFRGGYMPCKVKNSAIVIDTNSDGQYIRRTPQPDTPECPYLEMKEGKVYDFSREIFLVFGAPKGEEEKPGCEYSELGTLLMADEYNNIFFNQKVYDTFYTIINHLKKTENGEEISDKEQQLAAPYDAAPYSVNQIGDFLKYVENERTTLELVEEIQEEYDDMIERLYNILGEFGFEPTETFDITLDRDYNLARGKLDEIKNKMIASAREKITEINIADNEVVEERVNKFKKIIAALEKDRQEQTTITEAVVDNNNLDEDIKTAKVDEEVGNTFEKKLEEFSTQTKLPTAPYQANY